MKTTNKTSPIHFFYLYTFLLFSGLNFITSLANARMALPYTHSLFNGKIYHCEESAEKHHFLKRWVTTIQEILYKKQLKQLKTKISHYHHEMYNISLEPDSTIKRYLTLKLISSIREELKQYPQQRFVSGTQYSDLRQIHRIYASLQKQLQNDLENDSKKNKTENIRLDYDRDMKSSHFNLVQKRKFWRERRDHLGLEVGESFFSSKRKEQLFKGLDLSDNQQDYPLLHWMSQNFDAPANYIYFGGKSNFETELNKGNILKGDDSGRKRVYHFEINSARDQISLKKSVPFLHENYSDEKVTPIPVTGERTLIYNKKYNLTEESFTFKKVR